MRDSAEIQWTEVRNVGDVRMGKQLSPASRDAPGQFPYLRVANVHLGRIDYADVNTMGFTGAERETYGLKPGDILLNEGQSLELVGRSAIYDGAEGKFCFQNTLIRFRPGADVLPAYAQVVFERWLATGVFAAIAKQTTSIAHLGGDRFGALLFPLIPVAAQRRIVEVIDSFTELKRGTEASIAKLRSTRQAALMSAIESEIPSGEERAVSLSSLLERIEAGWSPACEAVPPGPDEWGVIRVSAVTSGYFSPNESKRLPHGLSPRMDLEVRPGDLLMARANGARSLVGVVCLVGRTRAKLMLSDKTLRLIPNEERSNADYLFTILSGEAVRAQVEALLSGSTGQGNISQTAVRRLLVPNVPRAGQRKVVALARSFDEQISSELEELAKLHRISQGLADDLLSGRGTASVAA